MAQGHCRGGVRTSMTGTESPAPPHGWPFAAGLLGVGLLALILGLRLPTASLGDNQDPGPRAVPVTLGVILILGGLGQGVAAWRGPRGARSAPIPGFSPTETAAPPVVPEPPPPESEASGTMGDTVFLLVAVVLYVAVLPWIGFHLSTAAFVLALMRRLQAGWWTAGATAAGLVVLIHVLFVALFRVQLPSGRLGLPF